MADGKKTGVDFGLFILRLALGGIFIAHGVTKLMAPKGLAGFTDFVASLGLPQPQAFAIAAVAAELGGSLLVILGLFTRLGALSLVVVAAVALWGVHLKNGFFLVIVAKEAIPAGEAIRHGCEYTVALGAMALCILFAGPGGLRIPIGKKH